MPMAVGSPNIPTTLRINRLTTACFSITFTHSNSSLMPNSPAESSVVERWEPQLTAPHQPVNKVFLSSTSDALCHSERAGANSQEAFSHAKPAPAVEGWQFRFDA